MCETKSEKLPVVEPNNRRIIVIDDNPAIHRDLRQILEDNTSSNLVAAESRAALFGTVVEQGESFQVDVAYQGQEGCEKIRAAREAGKPYAVAFVDVRMPPGWDGVVTIKNIWKIDPDVHVVICTAYADYGWQELTEQLGHSDQWLVLRKPFDTVEAKQLATALAAKWRATQQARLKMNQLEQLIEIRTRDIQLANKKLTEEIRERERAQAAEREKDELLRHAQKMEIVGALAGGVAHEFNNLLQVIIGYTQYALEELDPDSDISKDLNETLRAAEKAATLTKQLLSFGRRQPLRLADLNPVELIQEVDKLIRPLLGEHIEVELQVLGEPPKIRGDANQLHQVLLNLCVNARDAMPDGGKLTLRCQHERLPDRRSQGFWVVDLPPADYVVFSVEDTGCGMSPEVMKRIFEPFFTTKEAGKGTGLGLAMVYGIVKQHGGGIYVESTPGKGTSFRIYIPVTKVQGKERPTEKNSQTKEKRYEGNETILVVEDEPAVRRLAVRSLQRMGYRVLEARNGAEGVELFNKHSKEIDLVILDMLMPKLNGRDAYEQMRNTRPDLKAIFCSAHDPESARKGFWKDSAPHLIQKPYRSETLLKTVRAVLDGKPVNTLMQQKVDELLAEVN